MKIVAISALAAVLAIGLSSPTFAAGKKSGFGNDSSSTSTQGSGGQANDSANPDNEGQTTVTTETTGPRGQLKQGSTDCNNCDTTTTVDQPGKNR